MKRRRSSTELAESSLAGLFRAEYPRLVRALTVAFGPEIAAEAVQEAFVQAHLHWKRIDSYSEPAAWVRRVAVNRALTRAAIATGRTSTRPGSCDRYRWSP